MHLLYDVSFSDTTQLAWTLIHDFLVRYMSDWSIRIDIWALFATGGRLAPEIRQRIGHAKSEFRRHRKAIYGQSKLTCQRRVQLFKTLVLTSLMYNIAVWPPLTKQEHTQFVTGLLSLYSSLAYAIFGPEAFTWRDERILSRLGLPSPNEVFHMARLRYLQHIILQGDSVIWTVLQLESSWLSLIDQDLAWLRGQAPWRVPQTDPRDSWDSWNVLIRTGGQWKNLVNKAGVHAQLQRRRQSDWYDWHRAFLDMLSAHQLWQDTRSTDMQGIHACLKCRKRFSTKAAWSVHAFKIHSRLTPARKFADGVECKVCMRRYGSHDRLVNHLKYSVKCQREHRRRQLFVTPQPSVNSAALRRQQTDGVLPILPVHGPQHEPAPPEPYDWTDGLGPAEQACIDELVDLYEQLAKEPINTVDAITVVHTIFNRSWTYAPRLINLFCISMDDYIRVELATGTNEDEITVARFDDPGTLPTEVSVHWQDLQMSTWRLHRCHASIATSRTWEGVAGPHFILLDGRESCGILICHGDHWTGCYLTGGRIFIVIQCCRAGCNYMAPPLQLVADWTRFSPWSLVSGWVQWWAHTRSIPTGADVKWILCTNPCCCTGLAVLCRYSYWQSQTGTRWTVFWHGLWQRTSMSGIHEYQGIGVCSPTLWWTQLSNQQTLAWSHWLDDLQTTPDWQRTFPPVEDLARHSATQSCTCWAKCYSACSGIRGRRMPRICTTVTTNMPSDYPLPDSRVLFPVFESPVYLSYHSESSIGLNSWSLYAGRWRLHWGFHFADRCSGTTIGNDCDQCPTKGTLNMLVLAGLRTSQQVLMIVRQQHAASTAASMGLSLVQVFVSYQKNPDVSCHRRKNGRQIAERALHVLMSRQIRLPSCRDRRFPVRLQGYVFDFVGLHGYSDMRVVDTTQPITSQLGEGWSRIRRTTQPIIDLHTVEYPSDIQCRGFSAYDDRPVPRWPFRTDSWRRCIGGCHYYPPRTAAEREAAGTLDSPQDVNARLHLFHEDAMVLWSPRSALYDLPQWPVMGIWKQH